MNYRLVSRLLGNMLLIEALLLIFPLSASFVYGASDAAAFLLTMLVAAVLGTPLSFVKPGEKKFREKDAFAAAALTWIVFSIIGALPFYFSGYFNGFVDCVFESVSGFTTTGATILTQIEGLPRGILFWRSFTHWLGGMGVLVFILAVLPTMNASSVNLLRAESTGLSPDRIVPKIRETARFMYLIYLAMTAVLTICLFISGMPVYDSLINAFSTAGTGGFSSMNASFGAYGNVAAEIIVTVFMFLFGVSFTLYFYLIKRKLGQFLKDGELRLYFGVVAAAIIIITINISGMYGSIGEALRYSSFQVSSVISTTGYVTANFDIWPTLSKVILMTLMVTGCCAGSTGGGVKLVRVLVLFKAFKTELGKIVHSKSVKAVTINGKKLESGAVTKAAIFLFVYFLIFLFGTALVSIEGKDIVTSVTAVISALGNVGPGLAAVGPVGNFSSFTPFSKIVLSVCMLAGRLELFPLLVLFVPSVWKRKPVL